MPLARALDVILGGSPSKIIGRMVAAIGATDRAAIDALGSALQGSDRSLVATFATMGIGGAPGSKAARPATETDPPDPQSPGYSRAVNEAAIAAWATRGVRACLLRLAPSVHGDEDKGLVPQLIRAARKSGGAIHVDDGSNRWCGVHRNDAAVLYRLALEKGVAGGVYHAVDDEGVPFREISQVIGRRLSLPVKATTLTEARRHFGFLAPFIAVDNPATSEQTRRELGWQPSGPPLLKDIDRPGYFPA